MQGKEGIFWISLMVVETALFTTLPPRLSFGIGLLFLGIAGLYYSTAHGALQVRFPIASPMLIGALLGIGAAVLVMANAVLLWPESQSHNTVSTEGAAPAGVVQMGQATIAMTTSVMHAARQAEVTALQPSPTLTADVSGRLFVPQPVSEMMEPYSRGGLTTDQATKLFSGFIGKWKHLKETANDVWVPETLGSIEGVHIVFAKDEGHALRMIFESRWDPEMSLVSVGTVVEANCQVRGVFNDLVFDHCEVLSLSASLAPTAKATGRKRGHQ